ncbi:MAG: metallopeptidase TldD-related protein, partial [Bacteroidetes bacterium]|nr:metallopeptidase TldD-related protein [Bacteroidota bacterium]
SASGGVILQTTVNPGERISSVRLILGDNTFSSDYSYSGNGIMGPNYVTVEEDAAQIKAAFWSNSDIAYKFALEAYNSKKSNIKNANLSEQEKELPEFIPMQTKEVMVPFENIDMRKKLYEEMAVGLSAQFGKDRSILLSNVEVGGIETVYYRITSEGVKTMQAVKYVDITLKAKVRLPSGQVVSLEKYRAYPDWEALPDRNELLAEVNRFFEHLLAVKNAEKFPEYYLGPVLFEDEAVVKIFSDNLISPSGLLASRKPIQVITTVARAENLSEISRAKPLEERLGKKVIDSRLSVYNRTDMATFNGKHLLGPYTIDAQGVIPKPEWQLIENGILKSLLTQNVPTVQCKESTGSYRFGTRSRMVAQELAPGALLIEAPKGDPKAELKAALMAAAKEEGLDYGYIVRKYGEGADQLLYRVSVADGSETMVINCELAPVPLAKLKRVLGVSNEQYAQNIIYKNAIPCAIICPSGLLLEDIEINLKRINLQKDSELIRY